MLKVDTMYRVTCKPTRGTGVRVMRRLVIEVVEVGLIAASPFSCGACSRQCHGNVYESTGVRLNRGGLDQFYVAQ